DIGIQLLVELKIHGKESEDYVERVVNELYRLGIAHRAIVQSLDLDVLERLRAYDPTIETSDLLSDEWEELPKSDGKYFSLKNNRVTDELVQSLREERIRLFVWTVDERKDMKEALKRRVAGIITNEVDDALEERTEYERQRTLSDRASWVLERTFRW
ncbi:MAG TPA: glycerophosphodiester phosphodiesterase family protein, partial [Savagea sp.]